jgi:hypothetical protein
LPVLPSSNPVRAKCKRHESNGEVHKYPEPRNGIGENAQNEQAKRHPNERIVNVLEEFTKDRLYGVGKFAAACITIQSGSPWFPPVALFLRGHYDRRHSAVPARTMLCLIPQSATRSLGADDDVVGMAGRYPGSYLDRSTAGAP